MKSKIHELQKINLKTVSKKMFFTAVALVAFSATSMANTVEVKEVVIPIEEEVVVKKSCIDKALDAYEAYINEYNGGADNLPLLQSYVSICR